VPSPVRACSRSSRLRARPLARLEDVRPVPERPFALQQAASYAAARLAEAAVIPRAP